MASIVVIAGLALAVSVVIMLAEVYVCYNDEERRTWSNKQFIVTFVIVAVALYMAAGILTDSAGGGGYVEPDIYLTDPDF